MGRDCRNTCSKGSDFPSVALNLLKHLHKHLAEILEFCATEREEIHFSMKQF